ncbi:Hypothetical predicted protein [Paramuricea clavata]|uniref:Uncharacterized protein n=1 Tax=Paramuricea clavata TaxID=317549 RepID=A0A7D9LST4_PARCT|nr:Hypothetical predicted protein [Paramuricea clavata]
MDAVAITNASDELLKEMGLSKAGDRLSLKDFCAHQEDESSSQEGNKNRKRALLEAFLSRKKEQIKKKSDNFKGEEVEESIKVGREYIPFTLCNYMEAHKIRTVRLYLQSRKIDGSDNDDDLLSSTFDHDLNQEGSLIGPHLERQSLVSRNQESSLINSTLDMQSLVSPNQKSSLIGFTLEGQSLASEQDKEYQESLKADERKAVSRERENEESKRKKRIQNVRADRVVPEPDDEFVTVKVRHIAMGLQSRKFPKTSRMAAVYDWAGSLSPDPENFTIYHLGGDANTK